ncbi:MAG: exo-alpha-sialidase [Myxococcota bacterium]
MNLYVSTRKGLFVYDCARWTLEARAFVGDPVSLTLPARPAAKGEGPSQEPALAALHLGHFGTKLRAVTGNQGTDLAVPVYPEQPAEAADDVKWSLEQIWSLERDAAGTYWAGTIPGGLFRSDDLHGGWTLVRSLWDRPERKKWFGGGYDKPGIHSVCVHPEDPNELLVAVSCGGVWRSTDRGETWSLEGEGLVAEYLPEGQHETKETQDPHAVRRCRAVPEVLWMQHHNGVFRSTDGGQRWTSIRVPPSAFGFAVAAHPSDPNTAWFVPAVKDEQRVPVDGAVVVSRTRDGGETFEVLRDGLPQEDAYDLTYRHALDIDDSGNTLAFGSTTGSLWISEDQGEHWRSLSNHLPPIYAVRFGD